MVMRPVEEGMKVDVALSEPTDTALAVALKSVSRVKVPRVITHPCSALLKSVERARSASTVTRA